ncbi:hypothetical protein [Haladaptatus salinisoli]|uniref:hypothetical protein n=1 Tax=Haladaptatus salinisoli TaxID=2884876 RepID=UPI001D0B234B|nr:hypothetical protein [Haladaptatus salinisoli]
MTLGEQSFDEYVPGGEADDRLSVHQRLSQWFLLRGTRLSVTVFLLTGVLAALLLLSVVRPVDMHNLLSETNTVQSMFNTLLSGIILLVSIVVSINSIVFSQEITDIQNQRERIDASIQYRGRIEEFLESNVSPARPAEFLRVILRVIDQQTTALANIAAKSDDDEFREEAEAFSDRVTADTERAGETLSNAEFGTFKVLLAGLNYDYSRQLNAARRFKRKYGNSLADDEREAINDLIDTLKFFATGREYFKSLYYKRELARLSSRLLYVSLPTIVFTSYVLLALDTNIFPSTSVFGISPLLLFVSVSYTIALAPYVILTAYVIRAVTVTLNTLAAGPFILQRGAELDEFDWSEHASNDWNVTSPKKEFSDD